MQRGPKGWTNQVYGWSKKSKRKTLIAGGKVVKTVVNKDRRSLIPGGGAVSFSLAGWWSCHCRSLVAAKRETADTSHYRGSRCLSSLSMFPAKDWRFPLSLENCSTSASDLKWLVPFSCWHQQNSTTGAEKLWQSLIFSNNSTGDLLAFIWGLTGNHPIECHSQSQYFICFPP